MMYYQLELLKSMYMVTGAQKTQNFVLTKQAEKLKSREMKDVEG